MNKLIKAIEDGQNYTRTENSALTHQTTKSDLLDFFAKGGAMRNQAEDTVSQAFRHAFDEDKLLATKALFYFRDVRGGQGERRLFRLGLDQLVKSQPSTVKKNFANIVEFGRWDDLFGLFGTPLEGDMIRFVHGQLAADASELSGDGNISLLGKWLPSENASSKVTKERAQKFAKAFDLSARNYRKLLAALRKRIKIVETAMCQNEWTNIDYQKVPSRASMIYRNAFKKHDENGYQAFLEAVEKGEAKINASVLYPSDIVEKVIKSCGGGWSFRYDGSTDQTLNAQWNALPNYLEENPHEGLVMADVSGSMDGQPMAVSVALAIYFAQRNEGPFKDYFMTFTDRPKLVKTKGDTIERQVESVFNGGVGYNTNLNLAFSNLLKHAVDNNVPQKDMPRVIYVISDMQFDEAVSGETNYQTIDRQYREAGYERPIIVFWNVRASHGQPVTADENGTVLVSGYSPSTFKTVLTGKSVTPYEIMLETLNQERYNSIKL